MIIYYTEYPKGQFQAFNDNEALSKTNSKVVYKESDTKNGTPFIIVRNTKQ